MGKKFWTFWRDPVVSAVIAAGIVAAIPAIWGAHGLWWQNLLAAYSIPLWLIVLVAGLMSASLVFNFRSRRRKPSGVNPQIRFISANVSFAALEKSLTFPLKCHFQFCNDSPECVEVRIGGFEPKKVTLKAFVPNVLQVKLRNWSPESEGVDRIAVLPDQIFQAWIGIDEKTFDERRVRDLLGQLGTLLLIVDGNKIPFDV